MLVLLNMTMLAGIVVAHLVFGPALGTPPRLFFFVLLGRFLMQALELTWIGGAAAAPLSAWADVSIWLNVAFAFVLSLLGGLEHSHYVALLLLPVIATAARKSPAWIALVVAVATVLTFLKLAIWGRSHAPVTTAEWFEAASVALIYLVVAVVVAILVSELRNERARLADSLLELGRARDRLVEEEKLAAVGRLSSAIAHEIRNPVAMIVSSLDLARRKGCASPTGEPLCAIASEEARRLETLTGDFLSYAATKAPSPVRTSAATLVGYVVELARAHADTCGVAVEGSGPEELVLLTDPHQLQQALLNLVLNGVEAAGKGGRVSLTCRNGSGAVSLEVEDDGPGVPAEAVARLFEPFFTTRPRGTGLGLAIARKIARRHGGDLRLASNAAGGVRFALTLPPSVVVEQGAALGARAAG